MTPVTGIDFARITLRDALDLAVLIEEEARDRYVEFAEQLAAHATPEVADFFARMARIEERHRAELLERRNILFGSARSTVERRQIFDVEAPGYEEARAFMGVRQALETVLAAEVKAGSGWVSFVAELLRDRTGRAALERTAGSSLACRNAAAPRSRPTPRHRAAARPAARASRAEAARRRRGPAHRARSLPHGAGNRR